MKDDTPKENKDLSQSNSANQDTQINLDFRDDKDLQFNNLSDKMDSLKLDSNFKDTDKLDFKQKTRLRTAASGEIATNDEKKRTVSFSTLPPFNNPGMSIQHKSTFERNLHKTSTFMGSRTSNNSNAIFNYFDESSKILSNTLRRDDEKSLDNNYFKKCEYGPTSSDILSMNNNSFNPNTDNEQPAMNYQGMDFFIRQSPKKGSITQNSPMGQPQANSGPKSSSGSGQNLGNILNQKKNENEPSLFLGQSFKASTKDDQSTSSTPSFFPNPVFAITNTDQQFYLPPQEEHSLQQNQNSSPFDITKYNPEDYIFEKFGKKGWQCAECNNFNFETRNKCNRCSRPMMPKLISKNKKEEGIQSEDKRRKPLIERKGDWVCPNCRNLNFAFRLICNRCQSPKTEVKSFQGRPAAVLFNPQGQFGMINNQFTLTPVNPIIGQIGQVQVQMGQVNQMGQVGQVGQVGQYVPGLNYIDPQMMNKNINIYNNFYSVPPNQKQGIGQNLNLAMPSEVSGMKNYMNNVNSIGNNGNNANNNANDFQMPNSLWDSFITKSKSINNSLAKFDSGNGDFENKLNFMGNNNSEESD